MFENKEFWSIIFLVVGAILVVLEFGLPTNFEIFAFGLGFMAMSLMTYIGINLLLQVLIFALIVSIVIFTSYKFARKSTEGSEDFSPGYIIGKIGKVIMIENDKVIVKVNGEEWLAESDEPLSVGDKVVVVDIKGVKVIVDKVGKKEV